MRWLSVLVVAFAITMTACGGGSDSSASGGAAVLDFPPPSLTSAEVCEMVGTNDIVAIFGGVSAAAQPTDARTGCWYSVYDGETTSGETTITLLNNGGRDGYEAQVDRWSSIGTVSEIADFNGTGYDGDAILVEKSSGPPIIVMFNGGSWVWEVGIGVHRDDVATVERIARTVAGQL